MTRKLLLATVLLLIGVLAGTVFSEVRASTSSGVDAEDWLVISDRLGIVIGPESPSFHEEPRLSGTLMAKTRGGWLPVHLEPPPPMPRPAT